MRKAVIYSLFCSGLLSTGISYAQSDVVINGAGATFPYPVYAKWASAYEKQTGVKLNYQAIGSGGGIKQIKAKTTDFGASDAPLTSIELSESDLMQFPAVMGGVVPIVNLPGLQPGELKLNGQILADIYMGKINQWDDKQIKALNPALDLPNQKITVVHRSDGSGTTFIFTDYLNKVSRDWQTNIGSSKDIAWPTGVGGKGNQGVASYVQRIKGAVGYVEFAYALQNKMSHVSLKNHDGKFVDPTLNTFQSAAANAKWQEADHYYIVLTDQPGVNSWPITGASFILLSKKSKDPEQTKEVLKFFEWAYTNGQKMATELDYVPMPSNVTEMVQQSWQQGLTDAQNMPIWPVSNDK